MDLFVQASRLQLLLWQYISRSDNILRITVMQSPANLAFKVGNWTEDRNVISVARLPTSTPRTRISTRGIVIHGPTGSRNRLTIAPAAGYSQLAMQLRGDMMRWLALY